MSIKILIVEDEPAIARDLSYLLIENNYQVVGIAYDVVEAKSYFKREGIDLVLLDINIEGNREGIDLGNLLNQSHQIPFIYITSYVDAATIQLAKKTHPYGYIIKPFDERDIYATIEIAWFNINEQLPKKMDSKTINSKLVNGLTKKEFEVLKGLIKGKAYAEIASDQFVSINTVSSHVKKIYSKLGVRNKVEALQFCNSV